MLLSPQEQQDLGNHDGAEEDDDHLSMHEVMTLVLLLNHPARNKEELGWPFILIHKIQLKWAP